MISVFQVGSQNFLGVLFLLLQTNKQKTKLERENLLNFMNKSDLYEDLGGGSKLHYKELFVIYFVIPISCVWLH